MGRACQSPLVGTARKWTPARGRKVRLYTTPVTRIGVPLVAAASVTALCHVPGVIDQRADADGPLSDRAPGEPQPPAPTRSARKSADPSDRLIATIPACGRSGSA